MGVLDGVSVQRIAVGFLRRNEHTNVKVPDHNDSQELPDQPMVPTCYDITQKLGGWATGFSSPETYQAVCRPVN